MRGIDGEEARREGKFVGPTGQEGSMTSIPNVDDNISSPTTPALTIYDFITGGELIFQQGFLMLVGEEGKVHI